MSLGIPLGTLRKPRLAQSTRKLYLEVPLALTHSCLQFVMSRSWLEPRTTCSRTRNTMWRKIIISFNPLQHPIWHYFSCFLLSSWFYVWEYADNILCGVVDICCLCVCVRFAVLARGAAPIMFFSSSVRDYLCSGPLFPLCWKERNKYNGSMTNSCVHVICRRDVVFVEDDERIMLRWNDDKIWRGEKRNF